MSFRRYRQAQLGEFFCVFADTAWGGNDYCAVQFLSKTKADVPIVYHSKVTATEMTPLLHLELERIFDATHVKPVVAYETNNGGESEFARLGRLNRNGKYTLYQDTSGATPKLGYTTNSKTRPAMLQMLKEVVDTRLIRLYDRPTVNEMFSFVVVQTTSSWKAQAESGAHDDLIMSLAGAWQLYQTEQPANQQNHMLYARDTKMEELWNNI